MTDVIPGITADRDIVVRAVVRRDPAGVDANELSKFSARQ